MREHAAGCAKTSKLRGEETTHGAPREEASDPDDAAAILRHVCRVAISRRGDPAIVLPSSRCDSMLRDCEEFPAARIGASLRRRNGSIPGEPTTFFAFDTICAIFSIEPEALPIN